MAVDTNTPPTIETEDIAFRLSAAEWIVVQIAMDAPDAPRFAQNINPELSEEALKGALVAARDALVAHDFARKGDNGRVELNPITELCALSIQSPQKSIALTIFNGDEQRQIFYNLINSIYVGNWVEPGQLHAFRITQQPRLAAALMAQLDPLRENLRVTDGSTLPLPASALPEVSTSGPNGDIAKRLVSGGVDSAEAAAIERAMTGGQRATLVVVDGTNDTLNAHMLLWFSDGKSQWLLDEDADNVLLKRVSNATMDAQVSAFLERWAAPV
jgi:hypothetical protein